MKTERIKEVTLEKDTDGLTEADGGNMDVEELINNGSSNSTPSSAGSQPTEDDFDLEEVSLRQDFDSMVNAKPVTAAVHVRKPRRQEWFRIHPDLDWRFSTMILVLKDGIHEEFYLVNRTIVGAIRDEIQPMMLFTVVNAQHEVFIWPVRLPKDGRTDNYMDTDMRAVRNAETTWTRRFWVPQSRSHKITSGAFDDEPVWPAIGFKELRKVAFKDYYIADLDHPILRRLRGDR